MAGCDATRCIPNLVSSYACADNDDCFDGHVCGTDGLCVSCGETKNEARYFANGACHQVQTFSEFAPYAEGESGCAGDHW